MRSGSNAHTVTIKWTNHLANEAFGKVDWAALHRCGVRRPSLAFVYAARSKKTISAKTVPVTKCIK
jgi:hypothetical protein